MFECALLCSSPFSEKANLYAGVLYCDMVLDQRRPTCTLMFFIVVQSITRGPLCAARMSRLLDVLWSEANMFVSPQSMNIQLHAVSLILVE